MRPYFPCICYRRRSGVAFALLLLAFIILLASNCRNMACEGEFIGDEDDFEDK